MLIDYHGNSYMINQWFMNFVLFGNVNIKYDITAIMLPDRKNINIYDGNFYIRKRIFFWHVNINLSHKRVDANSSMYPIDGASGNYLSLKQMKEKSSDLKEILKFDEFCFVPTTSALGLSNWQERLSSSLQVVGENTMCDRYYFSGDNNDCTNLIAFKDFLISELTPKIAGNTASFGQDLNLFVDNMPNLSLINYTWSIRNNNFKVVSKTGSHAVLRPLHFGRKDVVSVTASIPFVNLDFTVPSVDISTTDLMIEGDTYISKLKNRYKLNQTPDCDSLFWRVSEGVVIDKIKGNYVVAHTDKELTEPWIEAVVKTAGIENVFRKNLISKGIDSVKLSCMSTWYGKNDKGENCKKYAYMVSYKPDDIPLERLDFCWGNTVKKLDVIQNSPSQYSYNNPPIARPYPYAGLAEMITKGGVESNGICLRSEYVGDLVHDQIVELKDSAYHGRDSLRVKIFPKRANVPVGPSDPPILLDNDGMYKDWGDAFYRVLVIMPILEKGEAASGILRCSVSDYINDPVLLKSQELSVEGTKSSSCSYSLSSNPVNSVLSVTRTMDNSGTLSALGRSQVSEPLVVALYNDFGMVRSVTFDDSQPSVDMNVSDLAAGTYYLNIMKNGNVIDRQVIFIKH